MNLRFLFGVSLRIIRICPAVHACVPALISDKLLDSRKPAVSIVVLLQAVR